MGKTTHEIESEIVDARNRLGRDLNALESRIRQTVDWRHQFREKPNVFLGAAFGIGLLLGLIAIPNKSSERRRLRGYPAY